MNPLSIYSSKKSASNHHITIQVLSCNYYHHHFAFIYISYKTDIHILIQYEAENVIPYKARNHKKQFAALLRAMHAYVIFMYMELRITMFVEVLRKN